MAISISIPKQEADLKPRIVIFGIGGAGCNAVNNMIASNLEGADFWVANTDAQSLTNSAVPPNQRIQLGMSCTKGLGAGSYPEVGAAAAEESINEIRAAISGCHMLFITAGMGGGTGTGAAPVVARVAQEEGVLVVGVVTKPFHFEGVRRMKTAELGLEEIEKYVDTIIIIPNQNLFRVVTEKTTLVEAFKMADDVLHSGVRSITDLITMPGLINLDFADIKTIMQGMGKAMMGTGDAEGEGRAIRAAEAAISNPLLDNSSMKGAMGVLINITGGADMTLFEVDEAANRIKEEVNDQPNAHIIFGSAFNNDLKGTIRVSVVATGIEPKHDMQKKEYDVFLDGVMKSATESASQTQNLVELSGSIQKAEHFKDNFENHESSLNETDLFIPPKAAKPGDLGLTEARDIIADLTNVKKSLEANDVSGKESCYVHEANQIDGDVLKRRGNLFEIPAFLRKKKRP